MYKFRVVLKGVTVSRHIKKSVATKKAKTIRGAYVKPISRRRKRKAW